MGGSTSSRSQTEPDLTSRPEKRSGEQGAGKSVGGMENARCHKGKATKGEAKCRGPGGKTKSGSLIANNKHQRKAEDFRGGSS